MSDFYNQCAEELKLPHGDLGGICEEHERAHALCEGCGETIVVDCEGNKVGKA